MATLAEHICAKTDPDLLARITAAAEVRGITSPQAWAESHLGQLVSIDIGETTIADVHAYGKAHYSPEPRLVANEWVRSMRPGENPSGVTDVQILAAVDAVVASEQPPETSS